MYSEYGSEVMLGYSVFEVSWPILNLCTRLWNTPHPWRKGRSESERLQPAGRTHPATNFSTNLILIKSDMLRCDTLPIIFPSQRGKEIEIERDTHKKRHIRQYSDILCCCCFSKKHIKLIRLFDRRREKRKARYVQFFNLLLFLKDPGKGGRGSELNGFSGYFHNNFV